jgi:hypothetical protein
MIPLALRIQVFKQVLQRAKEGHWVVLVTTNVEQAYQEMSLLSSLLGVGKRGGRTLRFEGGGCISVADMGDRMEYPGSVRYETVFLGQGTESFEERRPWLMKSTIMESSRS